MFRCRGRVRQHARIIQQKIIFPPLIFARDFEAVEKIRINPRRLETGRIIEHPK